MQKSYCKCRIIEFDDALALMHYCITLCHSSISDQTIASFEWIRASCMSSVVLCVPERPRLLAINAYIEYNNTDSAGQ